MAWTSARKGNVEANQLHRCLLFIAFFRCKILSMNYFAYIYNRKQPKIGYLGLESFFTVLIRMVSAYLCATYEVRD